MESILSISKLDVIALVERAKGLERAKPNADLYLARKMCPTRHGCQGATDCNYSYGGYPG